MADVVHLECIELMDDLLATVNKDCEVRKTSDPTIYGPSKSLTQEHLYQYYFPRQIALGLYNENINVKESSTATVDRSKVQIKLEMANVFKETVKKSWMEICCFVVEEPEEMKSKYHDCPIDDAQAIRNILTLDAVFVTCVLHTLWDAGIAKKWPAYPFDEIVKVVQERGLWQVDREIFLDILAIFRNQIPFQLIENVVKLMYKSCPPPPERVYSVQLSRVHDLQTISPGPENSPDSFRIDVSGLLQSGVETRSTVELIDLGASPGRSMTRYPVLSKSGDKFLQNVLNGMVYVACKLMMYNLPSPDNKSLKSPPLEEANYSHLLDCVYKTALQHGSYPDWVWPQANDATPPVATATQLKRAGINIVRGAENISDIKFKRGVFGATLILPQIRITLWTETILRNLVEYESRVLKKGDLMCYLSFMDELIDTKEDVLLLKEKQHSVIESQLSSDSEVAKIFNSLLPNSSEVPMSKRWVDLRRDIHKFYSSEKRQLWVEFYEIHFGRPWITTSVVAAFALLALTFLQTLYTMKSYYEDGASTSLNATRTG